MQRVMCELPQQFPCPAACLLSGVKRTQITHAPRHICVLAKNRLTHVLRSSFSGLRLSVISYGVLPGERAYPSGVGHNSHRKALVAVDRRLSFFGLIVLARGPMAIDAERCRGGLSVNPLYGVTQTSTSPTP